WLNSANTAPVGKQAATNYERYSNPSTDKLLDQYETTTSASTQQDILNKLQEVMLNDVPIIPVMEAVDWFQYDVGSFSGWPTPGNSSAQPSPYAYPDNEQVLLRLTPRYPRRRWAGLSGKSPAQRIPLPRSYGSQTRLEIRATPPRFLRRHAM